jgi:ribosomal protein L15
VTESENKTPEFDKTKLSGATTITDADGEVTEEVVGIDDATGMAIIVRYKKSFTARIIQSADESKGYYSELKNYILGYKKTTSRVSWGYDSINSGRNQLAKFVVRGKTLCLYLALNAADYTDSKYKVEAVESKKYEDTPCLYRIKNDLRLKYAKELIDTLAEKQGLEKGDEQNEDYRLPYETTEALVEKGLIKELVTEEKYEQFMYRRSQAEVDKNRRQFVSATEVNAIIDDDVAATLVEVASDKSGWSGKKGIVNIDDLSANFASGDRVTLNDLKEKGLVAKNVGYIKVLARGVLDKPLTVEANDYSLQAVKMILITGGHARKV